MEQTCPPLEFNRDSLVEERATWDEADWRCWVDCLIGPRKELRWTPPTHPTHRSLLQLSRIKLPRGCTGESTNPDLPRGTDNPGSQLSLIKRTSVGKGLPNAASYLFIYLFSAQTHLIYINVDIPETVQISWCGNNNLPWLWTLCNIFEGWSEGNDEAMQVVSWYCSL